MKPSVDNMKQKASRNLFGVTDSKSIETLYKEVMRKEKVRFMRRWGFDPDKLSKMTRICEEVCCSAKSIGEMREGDFVVVNCGSWLFELLARITTKY